jgi:hypothetical protein
MSITSNYTALKKLIDRYESLLNNFSEEEFTRKISEGKWSKAEVYAHIISANRMTIKAMLKAANGEAKENSDSLSWPARIIFLLNKMPKGRKVPAVVEARTPKFLNKQDAYEAINNLKIELDEVYVIREKWSKTQKNNHPALGPLNNAQWLAFMKVHTLHHLKQV